MPSHKKAVIISVSAAILIITVVVGYFFWWSSPKDASIAVTLPEQILAGVPFPLTVAISNDSNVTLKDVQVAITLPAQFIFAGAEKKTFENIKLGDLEVGKLAKKDFQIISLGNEHTNAQIKAVISYVPGSFRSRFEKTITKSIVVGDSGVSLDIIPPMQVASGEPFEIKISYQNTSESAIENARLHIVYPDKFVSSDSNSIELGTLDPGFRGDVTIKGSLSGQTAAVFTFRANLTGGANNEGYPIAEKTADVSIISSPLSLLITSDESAKFVSPGSTQNYHLYFANNTTTGLQNVIISAKLIGEMFDLSGARSDGALRAGDNTIVWNASRVPSLSFLDAGAQGSVTFSIPIKATYPIKRLSSKNFTLRVDGQAESLTVPRGVSASKTVGVASLESKITGKLALDSKVYFRDASSGILNGGAFPPRVGQATQYTVHWVFTNYATDADQVTVKAFLGPNVRFIGQAKTNIDGGTLPTYDERTQEVSWQVGKVPANRGILSPAYEAIFQIELTPAINQVESSPVLIREARAPYIDVFTGESMTAGDGEVNTQLPDDKSITGNEGKINP